MMVYKYVNAGLLEPLETSTVRFTQRSSLNDPFEMTPNLEAALERLVEELLSNPSKIFAEIEAFSDSDFSTKQMIRILNGTFDGDPETLGLRLENAIRRFVEVNVAKAAGDASDAAFPLFSTSRSRNNLLMWSHYCNSHKGYVIGFDVEDFLNDLKGRIYSNRAFDVVYSTERYVLPRDVLRKTAFKNIWSDSGKHKSWFTQQALRGFFLTKSVDWMYEEEVRFFANPNRCDRKKVERDSQGNEILLYNFAPSSVREIILGYKIPQEDHNSILKYWSKMYSHAKLYKAFPDSAKFAMSMVEFNEENFRRGEGDPIAPLELWQLVRGEHYE